MFGLSVDFDKVLRQNTAVLLFIPAVIFGYLFYLIGDLIYLWWGSGWAVLVSLLYGIRRSILYPIPRGDISLPTWYDTERYFKWFILIAYGFYIGPVAFFAALNNILPENQEIYLTAEPEFHWFTTQLSQGVIATDDIILIALLGIHLVTYILIAGPVILLYIIIFVWALLKAIGKILLWIFLRI